MPHKHKIVIAGNHDMALDPKAYRASRLYRANSNGCEEAANIMRKTKRRKKTQEEKSSNKGEADSDEPAFIYLEDESVQVEGYKFYGSPVTPTFHNWAFMMDRGPDIRRAWEKIPEDTEVLITHGPPLGQGDRCKGGHRAGCMDLLHAVQQRVRPLYHIFGHVHEGYGTTTDGLTKYINASTCNFQYRPVHPAIVFDLPRK